MRNMFSRYLVLGVLLLLSTLATAATYTYTGVPYTTATGAYTTAMSINGSFDTATPLPANMPPTAIGPSGSNLVTSWSFNDGVNTLNNTNSMELYGSATFFEVGTDAAGQINAFNIGFMSPLAPHTAGQPMNGIYFSAIQQATSAAPCTSVNNGVCTSIPTSTANWATSPAAGTWEAPTTTQGGPKSIPTMSIWGLGILASLVALIGMRRRFK